jgi:hypothetical protein
VPLPIRKCPSNFLGKTRHVIDPFPQEIGGGASHSAPRPLSGVVYCR